MNAWKSSPSTLAVVLLHIGVAACGGAQQARTRTTEETTMKDDPAITSAEKLLADLEAAFARKDLDGLVALFAEDATIESYLVTRIFDRKDGVCRGRAEIRQLGSALMERGTPWRGHDPPIVRGNTIAVEYRSASADGEKLSVDIIEVKDGKVQSLRAYAGWRAMAMLTGGARD
jgi:ketosteroid isomerase-like protein